MRPVLPSEQCRKFSRIWEHLQCSPGLILLEGIRSDPRGFFGRQVSASTFDADLVLTWLRYCDQKHIKHCASTTTSRFKSLGVINCETREIVNAPNGLTYVALSYVWSTDNPSFAYIKPGYLPETCSQVVKDAMQVVQRLNQRFLWVDEYCIDQNDSVDKNHQTADMDSICAGAHLTIISATGDFASHGLPGVGTTLRAPQPRVSIANCSLVSSLSNPAESIMSSI